MKRSIIRPNPGVVLGALLLAATTGLIPSLHAQTVEAGPMTIAGSLVVHGPVTVHGPLTVAGAVLVHGPLTAAWLEGPPQVVSTPREARRQKRFDGPVTVHGPLVVQGDLDVHGPLIVDGSIRAFGRIDADGPISERYYAP